MNNLFSDFRHKRLTPAPSGASTHVQRAIRFALRIVVASSVLQALVLGSLSLDVGNARGQDTSGPIWLKPFQWKNEAAPQQSATGRQSLESGETLGANSESLAGSSLRPSWRWLSPWRWQENHNDLGQQPATGEVVQAVASDLPRQPSSLQPAVADQSTVEKAGYVEPAVDWPPTEKVDAPEHVQHIQGLNPFVWNNLARADDNFTTPANSQSSSDPVSQQVAQHPPDVPTQRGPNFQGWNPFSWRDSTETSGIELAGSTASGAPPGLTRAASVAAEIASPQNLADAKQPFVWSNDPALNGEHRPLSPPEQRSFTSSLKQALSWQQPDTEEDPLVAASRPPADASDEELIAWEKERYPWIRPFYWSESEEDVSAFQQYEIYAESSEPARSSSPWAFFTEPFNWTNEVPRTGGPQRKRGGARTVAYLQEDEQGSLPPQQPGVPGQPEELPPIDGSESGESLIGDSLADELAGKDSAEGEEKEKFGDEETTLGREPQDNSLQFLRASTVLLDPGDAQLDYGLVYALFDQTIPVIVSSPAGTGVELARFRRREMFTPLEVRYGLARRIQMFLNVPFGWSNTEFSLTPLEEFENDGGIGDTIFGGSFLLRQGDHKTSDAVLTLAASAPTGQDPFAPIGIGPTAPALGSGTWSMASNVLFVRNYDPVVLFYGFGTRQYFLRHVNGNSFRPGGEYNYQMGVGFAANEKVTFSTRFNGAYISETRINGERVRGSIQEPMTLGFAVTLAKPCNRLVEPFVDFGLTDDSNSARFGVVWTR